MSFVVIIPARYASVRFPGKLLALCAGRPVLHWVCEHALNSGASEVVVATDHALIAESVSDLAVQVEMTSPDHESGTARLSEVIQRRGYGDNQAVICLQGDEPLLPSVLIDQLAAVLLDSSTSVASCCMPITVASDLVDTNVVKVVLGANSQALYFSRAAIPYDRDNQLSDNLIAGLYYRHIGMYAYRANFVATYQSLSPAPSEQLERLEQLRVLHHGYTIQMAVMPPMDVIGVDSPADLMSVERILLGMANSKKSESIV